MNYNFCLKMNMGDNDTQSFTMTWFYRALAVSDELDSSSPNYGLRRIDIGDRFISLWICFNSIMRELYGEGLSDNKQINKCASDPIWIKLFDSNRMVLDKYLDELMRYSVTNMRNGNKMRLTKKDFGQLIRIIYQIRCNLFHGRKDPYEDYRYSNDYVLIRLAFLILTKLTIDYLRSQKLVKIHLSENYTEVFESDMPKPVLEIEDFLDGLIFSF